MPPQESVREELERILSSRVFARAERPARFLRHLVESSLAGREEQLKESVLGVEIFGRQPGYDARLDAVVRVEASKLRARLEEYYRSPDAVSSVRISLPRGGYSPEFPSVIAAHTEPLDSSRRIDRTRFLMAGGAAAILGAVGWWGFAGRGGGAGHATLAVLPFQGFNEAPGTKSAAITLSWDLANRLSRLGKLRIVSHTSSRSMQLQQKDAREIGHQLNADWLVEGVIRAADRGFRVDVQLVDTKTGLCRWSESYEATSVDGALVNQIAEAVLDKT